MYKLVFAVVVVAVFCGVASAGVPDPYSRELVETFERCKLRLPPPIPAGQLDWFANNQRWYIKYWDEVYFNRMTKIVLAGKEERPYREISAYYDSPCFTNLNDPYIVDVPANENYTSGALGVTLPLKSTLTSSGVILNTIFFPNSQTPALSTTWVPVLSDGQTYNLHVSCLPEGHLGWQVASIKPELSSAAIQDIKDYLNKVGFKDNLTGHTMYRTSVCNNLP